MKVVNCMQWISITERLPTETQQPSIKVKIMINNNPDFVVICNFRMLATTLPGYSLSPHWFSDRSENGVIRFYYGVTHWKPISDEIKKNDR